MRAVRVITYIHLTVGEQYICVRTRVYTRNHSRAATLIRDNRADELRVDEVDDDCAVYTQV